MGYYTKYSLETDKPIKITLEELENLTDYTWDKLSSNEFEIEEEVKWYDHDNHMIELSKEPEYRNTLFTLYCKGEEGEEYKVYYKNGKSKSIAPVITWPEFNEEDLQ